MSMFYYNIKGNEHQFFVEGYNWHNLRKFINEFDIVKTKLLVLTNQKMECRYIDPITYTEGMGVLRLSTSLEKLNDIIDEDESVDEFKLEIIDKFTVEERVCDDLLFTAIPECKNELETVMKKVGLSEHNIAFLKHYQGNMIILNSSGGFHIQPEYVSLDDYLYAKYEIMNSDITNLIENRNKPI